MKRAVTNNNDVKHVNQRLQAAGKRAVAAHTSVKRLATRLKEEFETLTPSNGVVISDLDPEDSMVVAVERVITSQTTPPPMVSRARTAIGIAPVAASKK
jgi:hypothetical protein